MSTGGSNLAEIARLVGAELIGDAGVRICQVAPLQHATAQAISFYTNHRYCDDLKSTQAGAVLIHPDHAIQCPTAALVVKDPYRAYAAVAELLHPRKRINTGIHPTAALSPDVVMGEDVRIGAHVTIEPGVRIGDGVDVGAGSYLGADVVIGNECRLASGVTIERGCAVGARVVIHPGVIIGADGFGFSPGPGGWRKVPQLGNVCIGDDVEIGANSTIDRGTLEDTVIEDGVKIDNLVHIAHNARIGAGTVIAGCTVVAGSTTIGKNCVIGGASAITGHIELADGVTIMGMTGVTGHIRQAGVYASPLSAQPVRQWRRNTVRVTQLDELFRRVRHLERQINTTDTTDQ